MKVDGATNNYVDMNVSHKTNSSEKVSYINELAKSEMTTKASTRPKEKIQPKKLETALEGTETKEGITEQQEKQVVAAIEQANKQFRTFDRRLEFRIHDATKEIMVKVINTEDDQIIREIPSEKVLDMVAKLWEVAGILVDEKI